MIMADLGGKGLLKKGGGHFVLSMDNCGGQNKEWMVLRLPLYLVEKNVFEKVLWFFMLLGIRKMCATVSLTS